MLAYSSIAHAGYILVALVAVGAAGGIAALFYLLVYSFMTLGAFGVVAAIGAGRRAQRDPRRLRRPRVPPPAPRRHHDDLHAVADRHPAARRLRRQALHLHRRHPRGATTSSPSSASSTARSPPAYYVRVLIAMYLTPGAEEHGRVARQPYL